MLKIGVKYFFIWMKFWSWMAIYLGSRSKLSAMAELSMAANYDFFGATNGTNYTKEIQLNTNGGHRWTQINTDLWSELSVFICVHLWLKQIFYGLFLPISLRKRRKIGDRAKKKVPTELRLSVLFKFSLNLFLFLSSFLLRSSFFLCSFFLSSHFVRI